MMWSRVADAFRSGRRLCLVVVGVVAVGFASAGAAFAASWKVQAIPRGVPDLNAVSCSSPRACTAVGSGPPVLRSNGTKWSIEQTAKPASATSWSFAGVSCPSPTTCMAVGWFWIKHVRTVALAERWDGFRWQVLPLPLPGPKLSGLSAVSCTSVDACTAVGVYGSLPLLPSAVTFAGGVSLVERWNGSTWSIQRTPKTGGALSGVSCAARMLCTAVGANTAGDMIALRWAGRGWSMSKTPGPATQFWGVSCPSAKVCTIVGDANVGSGGASPVVTEWDGLRWTQPPPGADAVIGKTISVVGVSCTSARACTAVGFDGQVFEWNGAHAAMQWT